MRPFFLLVLATATSILGVPAIAQSGNATPFGTPGASEERPAASLPPEIPSPSNPALASARKDFDLACAKAMIPALESYLTKLEAIRKNSPSVAIDMEWKNIQSQLLATRAIAAGKANPRGSVENANIRTFLWNTSGDELPSERAMIYTNHKIKFSTKIIFKSDGTFRRNDNNVGKWVIEDGTLVTIAMLKSGKEEKSVFPVSKLEPSKAKGEITTGPFKGNPVSLSAEVPD